MSSRNVLSFFTALIFLSVFLCGVSWVDVVYIGDSYNTVNYIRQDSSGNFHETRDILPSLASFDYSAGSYGSVFSFTHNGRSKFLISKNEPIEGAYDSKCILTLYDAENLSAPLVSRDMSSYGMMYADGLAEYGSGLIMSYSSSSDCILAEINPDTLEIKGQPYKHWNESRGYCESSLAVSGDIIYVSFASRTKEGSFDTQLVIMDRPGNIVSRIKGLDTAFERRASKHMALSGGKFYFTTTSRFFVPSDEGIYCVDYERVKNLELTSSDLMHNYADKVISYRDHEFNYGMENICSDGKGGLYYVDVADGNICHWDGGTSTVVCEGINVQDLKYDPEHDTFFVTSGNNNSTNEGIFCALTRDSSGKYSISHEFGSIWAQVGNEVTVIKSFTETPITHSLAISPDEAVLTAELQRTASETLTFTGTKPDSWRASPDIPAGLGFALTSDDSSITLSIAPSERLTYSGILTLAGDYGTSADVMLMLSGIVSGEFSISPKTRTLELSAGSSESLSFSTVNSYGSVTWTAGTVTPSGVTLRLSQSENSKANFTASASENASGKYTAVITATDSAGRTASADITINVNVISSEIERLKREGKINQDGSPVVSFGDGGNFSATLQQGASITRKISLGFNVSSWKVSMTIPGGSTRIFTAMNGSDEQAVKITPESGTSASIEVNTAGLSEGDYKLSLSVIPEGTAEETNAADLGTLKISSSSNAGVSSSSSGGCNTSALSFFVMLSCLTLFRKKS